MGLLRKLAGLLIPQTNIPDAPATPPEYNERLAAKRRLPYGEDVLGQRINKSRRTSETTGTSRDAVEPPDFYEGNTRDNYNNGTLLQLHAEFPNRRIAKPKLSQPSVNRPTGAAVPASHAHTRSEPISRHGTLAPKTSPISNSERQKEAEREERERKRQAERRARTIWAIKNNKPAFPVWAEPDSFTEPQQTNVRNPITPDGSPKADKTLKDTGITRPVTPKTVTSPGTNTGLPTPGPTPKKPQDNTNIDVTDPDNMRKIPNQVAREFIKGESSSKSNGLFGAGQAVLFNFKEPLYAMRDVEIRDGLWKVMDKIEDFTKAHFGFELADSEDGGHSHRQLVRDAFGIMEPDTVRIIGCVASGGPGGLQGWYKLFTDSQKRRALVAAIIGNVLTNQVYQHVFFGGSLDNKQRLLNIEHENQNVDGFERKALYAQYIREQLQFDPTDYSKETGDIRNLRLPRNFHSHVNAIVEALATHLSPIRGLNNSEATQNHATYSDALYKIVSHAGILSLFIHLDPHTVYYHTPVFKEDAYDRPRMECFNQKQMEETHPRERKTWPADTPEEEKRRARGDEALTQITIMDGFAAYRRGGWEVQPSDSNIGSTPWAAQYQGDMAEQGIRERFLTQSWVFCRWGRPRKFVNGVPKDEAKIHGTKWSGSGFVEFGTLPGLTLYHDWKKTQQVAERAALEGLEVPRPELGPNDKGKERAA